MRIDGDTAAAQRLHITLQAIMAQRHIFRAGDTADTLMSQLVEIIYRVKGRRQVIDMDGGQPSSGANSFDMTIGGKLRCSSTLASNGKRELSSTMPSICLVMIRSIKVFLSDSGGRNRRLTPDSRARRQ